jgi:hypothetical protein
VLEESSCQEECREEACFVEGTSNLEDPSFLARLGSKGILFEASKINSLSAESFAVFYL